jgi:type I restriction enzyme S subunit
MHDMVITELRSFLSQYKDIVSIKPEESYKLVTISNKGIINLRKIVRGVEIKGDTAYRVKAGSFIYSRLAAHTGSYGLVPPELDGAIVTNEMPVFEINQNIVLSDYLLYVLRQKKFLNILIQLTRGMGRVRIKEDYFLNIKLPIHEDTMDQERVIESLDSKFENIEALDNKYLEQIGIIPQIRQALYQEAIEGNLTAKWRQENHELISGNNHAANLLEIIRAEKEQLVKKGKARKEKPLTPIADDEKPFDIPEGWVWCRLGEIISLLTDYHANGSYAVLKKHVKLLDTENYAIMLRTTNFQESTKNDYKYITKEAYEFLSKSRVNVNDVLMNKIADPGATFFVEDRHKLMSLAMNLFLIRFPNKYVNSKYAYYYLRTNYNYVSSFANGTSTKTITKDAVRNLRFPLPPFAEQNVIVERIDTQIALIDELEKQVAERKEQSAMLKQSVLREAFATN